MPWIYPSQFIRNKFIPFCFQYQEVKELLLLAQFWWSVYTCDYDCESGTGEGELFIIGKNGLQQECIPVGCVPSAAVAARGVVVWAGGCLPGGANGGIYPREGGVCAWVCVPRGCARGYLPDLLSPFEQNDWQMPVKILPCRNFVADGNK